MLTEPATPSVVDGQSRRDLGYKVKSNRELAQAIRATAYFLWEQDGKPEGRDFQYWVHAKEIHLRELAYDRWLAEGSPEGRDFDIWVRVSGEIDGG